MSCSKISNEYDGITHDYTKKGGLIWEQVFLPENAPGKWKDRKILWNAVEEAEKTKDSRLAREMIVALPAELEKGGWIELLTMYIKEQFISEGMCADVAIHDTDGHNPHAHILLTVRPLNPDGTWQNKSEKEYLCKRNGEEKGFTATEFWEAVNEGWEKQYQYQIGKKKVYLTPSEASDRNLERVSKYPKSTKYGRQNPIAERWNRDEQLGIWREAWAAASNQILEKHGHEERINHRSYAERGLDIKPTIHEGPVARAMEAKGIRSDRCEINREIRKDNTLILSLKEEVRKLTDFLWGAVQRAAQTLGSLRRKFLVSSYQGYAVQDLADETRATADKIDRDLKPYEELDGRIRSARAYLSSAEYRLENTPVLHLKERSQLKAQIREYDRELQELEKQEEDLLLRFPKTGYQYPDQAKEESKQLKQQSSDFSKEADQFFRQMLEAVRSYNAELVSAILEYSPEELWKYLNSEQEQTNAMTEEQITVPGNGKINRGAMKQAKEDLEEEMPTLSKEDLVYIRNMILQDRERSEHAEQSRVKNHDWER